MFAFENFYRIVRQRSLAESRRCAQADGTSRLWRVDESADAAPEPAARSIYAQNDRYLELCNPGWPEQWMAVPMLLFVGAAVFLAVWLFYGIAVHPLLTDNMIFLWFGSFEARAIYVWFGWIFLLPCAAVLCAYWHLSVFPGAIRPSFFTYARGRIRFNRATRKVYVLRPKFAGGNVVLDWNRMCAVLDWTIYDPIFRRHENTRLQRCALVLYCKPIDGNDPRGIGEDCLFVGPSLSDSSEAAPLWEYIRRYMAHGPGEAGIPERINQEHATYCGKPGARQYVLEQKPGFMETGFHILSQITCSWPAFPKEWESDSGMGEPEDKPVQTGAAMTALAYRVQGRLSQADEIEFLRHWGTTETVQEAMSRKP
jgi:hypothetical protein